MMNRLKSDWLKVLFICVLVRTLLYAWAFYCFDFRQLPYENWWSIWHRWDVLHFEMIAKYLYYPGRMSENEHQFLSQIPPGYPMAIRFFLGLGFPLYFTEYFISLGSFLIASLLLYELTEHELKDKTVALWAVVLLNLFPTSYFCQAPYSESLFLMWTMLGFYFLRVRESYWEACLATFLAITTRWIGVTIIPVLLFEGYRLFRKGSLSLGWWIASLLLPAAGVGVFFGINRYFYGSFFAFREHAKSNVSIVRIDSLPFTNVIEDLGNFLMSPAEHFHDAFFMFTAGWGGLFLLLATFTLPFVYKRLPLPYAIFSASYILFLSCLSWALSTNRYLLAVFPISMAFATIKSRNVRALLSLCFASFLLYFSQVFVHGTWAF